MDFGVNQGIVEELFSRYRDNPKAVAETWRNFFDAMSAEERAELVDGTGGTQRQRQRQRSHRNAGRHAGARRWRAFPRRPRPTAMETATAGRPWSKN